MNFRPGRKRNTTMVDLEVQTCGDRATPHRGHVWHMDLMTTEYYFCPGVDAQRNIGVVVNA